MLCHFNACQTCDDTVQSCVRFHKYYESLAWYRYTASECMNSSAVIFYWVLPLTWAVLSALRYLKRHGRHVIVLDVNQSIDCSFRWLISKTYSVYRPQHQDLLLWIAWQFGHVLKITLRAPSCDVRHVICRKIFMYSRLERQLRGNEENLTAVVVRTLYYELLTWWKGIYQIMINLAAVHCFVFLHSAQFWNWRVLTLIAWWFLVILE